MHILQTKLQGQEINSKSFHESSILHTSYIKISFPISFILPTICGNSKLFDLCVIS